VSNNDVIKSQYNGFRIQIARLVQSLESIRHASSDDVPSLMIDQLKVESDTQYTQQNKSINEMIRNRRITAEMAISLMNDASYVYNISRKLIEMGHTLFIKQNKELSAAEKTIRLDDNELKDIHDLHHPKTEELTHGS
ncbi:MAG: hypothetical protein WBN96_08340, partial [Gammaproteobacteria bacterium]